ncbi:hypothetical protein EVAR_56252_1 [Eumeta japonica]|uniref:Uncharacterized protein n=1 Tax=Eumeta variegata TaxID=151549 RepID=A0A4C1XJR6_EUMVA|nr:hypothetical protein EVAR_56252_1 [Eumeta japonica]
MRGSTQSDGLRSYYVSVRSEEAPMVDKLEDYRLAEFGDHRKRERLKATRQRKKCIDGPPPLSSHAARTAPPPRPPPPPRARSRPTKDQSLRFPKGLASFPFITP